MTDDKIRSSELIFNSDNVTVARLIRKYAE
jgi:hypothetical protein